MVANLAREVPEISVLMSCYNGSRWLAEAIDSVLAQTFKNFEFILVDDGSKDNTLEIIRAYVARDARVVVVSKKNTGLADSLNTGLALAKGAWVARIDQDDLCEPYRLERQLVFASGHQGLVLLGSGFAEIDERGKMVKDHRYPQDHAGLVARLERLQGFFPHSSAFYRAGTARRVGGYNTRITRADDRRLWLELSLQGEIACLPESLVRIRKHPCQMSLDNKGARQFYDAAAATVCHFLQKAGCNDPSVCESQDEWIAFLAWVESRMEHLGAFERRKAWTEARAEYLAMENRQVGLLRFGTRLLQSGCASSLLLEKFFGTSLPKRLAREWIKRQYNAL
jgi:glycosyl transferase family 2